jgi:hypothetical protein
MDKLPEYLSWGIPELVPTKLSALRWTCGFCGDATASDVAYYPKKAATNAGRDVFEHWSIRICQSCQRPTWHEDGRHYPPVRPGRDVSNVPEDTGQLYSEMRDAAGAGAHTASALTGRKILMHVAVEKGAKEGLSFLQYVNYLIDKGYVPTDSDDWVAGDTAALIVLTEQLLRNVYELPAVAARIRGKTAGDSTTTDVETPAGSADGGPRGPSA